ncbi:hypothetical protein LTR78_008021 [Recurvomyces mirabilis]|uniref:HD domain-containing protein n=1 Tax=Recurvomyces mirabilis TaxID=574656 RepID=A0AAE0TR99_9PEZI|nr:hypothetical protein LTR78_008021 [Recurvomyces mirabilis]KAK5150749.1 hypothetical protein LTS14_009812 [Recurvomyces mirabilis]
MAIHTSTRDEEARRTVQRLFSYIESQGQGDYLGERVSQLQHSLQAATLAQKANADEDTILGALLHDFGRFIPAAERKACMLNSDGSSAGKASHEVLGERYLRQHGFSEKICQLVGAHVMAKRYLTAVDKDYYASLSQASKISFKTQGGPFDDAEILTAQQDPLLSEKIAVRRWDDLAKDPAMQTPPLADFEDMTVRSLINSWSCVDLHGRKYALPTKSTVVICVDGFDPEYLDQGITDGILPNLAAMKANGFHATAHCAMPSFTNPNNVSIITGAPVSVHGIVGNYFLDRKTGKEEMITDDKLLRGSTLLELMSKLGVRVAAVTAKDKLRAILRHGLDGSAICFSAERAGSTTMQTNGIEDVERWLGQKQPSQYSGTLSLFVLDAGIKLLEEKKADLYYLTLSDFVQHKYAPGAEESNDFLIALDQRVGRLIELGAQVAITGDHGMSDKTNSNGTPNVLFLEDAIAQKWGQGAARIICPITDPFVKHHGALGSFVRVYAKQSGDVPDMLAFIKDLPQIEIAMLRDEAAIAFELPNDREGDIVVIAKANAVIGSRKEEHDLSNLEGHNLRSHGGLSEQAIPLLMSRPAKNLDSGGARQWRNFDAFDLVLNH